MTKLLYLLFLIHFIFATNNSWSQENVIDTKENQEKNENNNKFSWDKVYMGGGLGLQFGTITLIDISPIVGYRISENLSAGFGISYKYFSDNRYADYNSHIYGGNVFSRYQFLENIFGHIEYEALNAEYFELTTSSYTANNYRKYVGYLWIGGGYTQRMGGNSFINFMLLYNLNESLYSLYPNPIYRVGFNFGL